MRLPSNRSRRVRTTVLVATGALAVTTVLAGPAAAAPKTGDVPAPVRGLTLLREIVPAEHGLANPKGVAWSSANQQLVVAGDDGHGAEAISLTPDGSLAGIVALPPSSDPSTLAADDAGHAVVVDGPDVVEVAIDGSGTTREHGAAPKVSDPRDGLHGDSLHAVALNPADGLTYVADTESDLVVGLDDAGNPVRSYDLAELGITSLQAMAFGPSGDPTDPERRMSLFLVDAGAPGTNGTVMEATMAAVASTAPTVTGQLLRTQDLSQLNPTSPDPSGIAWMSHRSRLMISDGEVDEMPLYEGTNLYETTLTPTVTGRGTTLPWSNEPTGVGYNPANGHLFTSDDDKRRIFEVDDGADNTFGTADDVVTSFGTAVMGNTDPEGVEVDLATGDLYILDGLGREVTRVSPGSNGTFDGAPPTGDDTWANFDVAILGATDPEGMGYDPVRGTLLVLDNTSAKIYELARNGSLVNAIDISAAGAQAAAGVTIAPHSGNPGERSYYVVDRGLDNDTHPTENDGKMYELMATLPPLTNLPPLADAGPDTEIELPETAMLNGSFSDDGQPSGSVSVQWSVLSGPGSVSFGNANAAATTAGFTTPGIYTLRLTVDDGDRPDVDDATITVVGAGGLHNSQFPVAAGSDDAEEAAGGFVSVSSADLELVDDGTVNQTVGLRFGNLDIPAGAVIESAFVQFQADESVTSTGSASLRIRGEATDHAATYQAVSKNVTTRPTTISSAFWNPDPWPVVFERGPAQRSSDVGRIVQEIVDRPGWSAGNALALMVSGTGRRTAEARDGIEAPVLQVGWRRPVAGANRAPLVGAGAAQQIQLPQTASLSGTVTDDGLPSNPGTVTAAWTKVSGPGTVAFADAAAAVTSASFGEAGTYVLRLTGNDGALQSYDEVTVTVLAADAPQSASIPVATGADDAEQVLTGFMSTTNPDLELGVDGASPQLVGLRYALPIPAGAVVDSATVRFSTDEVSIDPAALTIEAEAADDAAAFQAVSRNLTNRARAPGSVAWNAAPWPTVNASGVAQTTPSFASVLQQVVDRPGWAAGNHAAVLISGTGRRTADALEDGHPAVLDLTWHLPLAGANRVPVADAGADQEVQLPGSAALAGTVADDGLPTPPGTVTSTWSKVSGPGTVTFVDPASPTTSADFNAPGEYVLRLTADDGALQA
ncbi:MAG: PKD domain-containing protein, partial [Nocardioidaceae bacterium]